MNLGRSAESSLPGLLSNRALHCVPDPQSSPWFRWIPGVLARPALPVGTNITTLRHKRASRSERSRTLQLTFGPGNPSAPGNPRFPGAPCNRRRDPGFGFPGSDIMKRILTGKSQNSPSLLEVLEARWIRHHHEVRAFRLLPSGPMDPELHGHPNMVHKSIINGPASQ